MLFPSFSTGLFERAHFCVTPFIMYNVSIYFTFFEIIVYKNTYHKGSILYNLEPQCSCLLILVDTCQFWWYSNTRNCMYSINLLFKLQLWHVYNLASIKIEWVGIPILAWTEHLSVKLPWKFHQYLQYTATQSDAVSNL